MMTILLNQVIDAIESVCDSYTEFYDTQTGQTVSLPDPVWTGETDEELEALLEAEPNRFLRFPTQFEIHEYKIIVDLVEALPEGKIQKELFSRFEARGHSEDLRI